MKKYFIQDGEKVPSYIENLFRSSFEYNDIKKKENSFFSRFVGFIIHTDKMLVSFPKHFLSYEDLISANEFSNNYKLLNSYSNLLMNTLRKSSQKKSENGIDIQKELNSHFPFEAFLNIYEYFKKYGLYMKEIQLKKPGYNGKIDWKSTIEKSPIIVNKKNILFMPPIINKKVSVEVFISKCMAYVIDSTAEKISIFSPIQKTNYNYHDLDWSNSKIIINKLRELKHYLFKDVHKKLLEDLIHFFENENYSNNSLKIKTHNFNLIWEDMIEKYLNNYFIGINTITEPKKHEKQIKHQLTFSSTPLNQKLNFSKTKFYTDKRGEEGHRLEPDHYYCTNSIRYLFDSKYYTKVKGLEYKQISYYYLLRKHDSHNKKLQTFNAILLPTERASDSEKNFNYHYEHSPLYSVDKEEFFIIEQYLNMIDVMKKY